jgi:hypothetical protein
MPDEEFWTFSRKTQGKNYAEWKQKSDIRTIRFQLRFLLSHAATTTQSPPLLLARFRAASAELSRFSTV